MTCLSVSLSIDRVIATPCMLLATKESTVTLGFLNQYLLMHYIIFFLLLILLYFIRLNVLKLFIQKHIYSTFKQIKISLVTLSPSFLIQNYVYCNKINGLVELFSFFNCHLYRTYFLEHTHTHLNT